MLTSKAYRATSKYALVVTLPLALLIGVASIRALVTPGFYNLETADWSTQSSAQDLVDLFLILPVFTLAGLYVHRGERLAEPIWGGSLLYLIYTFIIYCFNVHFNQLFLVYVGALAFSAWGFVYFLYQQQQMQTVSGIASRKITQIIGTYFIILAVAFYALWLNDVVQAFSSGKPSPTLVAAGLTTNPVHVLDLSLVLPGIFITGLLLYRQHRLGFQFAPVVLVFFILMDITIGVIFLAQQREGSWNNLPGALIMALLAIWSLVALLWFLRNGTSNPKPGQS